MAFESGSASGIALVVMANVAIVHACQAYGRRLARKGFTCPPIYTPKVTLAVEQRIYRCGRNCGRRLRRAKQKLLYVVGRNI